MPFYETVFVLEPTLAEEQAEEKLKDVQTIIEKNNGAVRKIERWGMRKLAYPIKHKREGMYFLIEFESSGSVVNDLEKHYRLQEFVLRYLTIRRERPSDDNYVSPLSSLAETRESVSEEVTKEVTKEELEQIVEEATAEPSVDIEEGIHEEVEEINEENDVASESESITSLDTEQPLTENEGEKLVEEETKKDAAESE